MLQQSNLWVGTGIYLQGEGSPSLPFFSLKSKLAQQRISLVELSACLDKNEPA